MQLTISIPTIFLFSIFYTAVVFAQDIPKWVESPYQFYPEETYLLGVGNASTLEEAQNIGMSNLSRIFSVKVSTTQELNSTTTTTITENSGNVSNESTFSNSASITSDNALYNVTLLESYIDDSGNYYALMGIKKSEALKTVEQLIEENKSMITTSLEKYREEENLINRFRYLDSVYKTLESLSIYVNQANVLSRSRVEFPEQLRAEYDQKSIELKNALTYVVEVDEEFDFVRYELIEVLTELELTQASSNPYLVIQAEVKYEEDFDRTNAVYLDWNFQLQVFRKGTSNAELFFEDEGVNSSQDYENAVDKNNRTITNLVTREVKEYLKALFTLTE
tara:strand:- start:62917 stop:63924 length:1008 start_codon:yes stop_codon:yes gene_type:complete